MAQPWRFLNTGSCDAALNMALDEAMFLAHEAGIAPSTLRLYAWQSPTLSLGYAQNAAREVNLTACDEHGVGVVRRPTGGRAVLHDQEVTYSVVMPLLFNDSQRSLTEHYHLIGEALAAALGQLGLPVCLVRPRIRGTTARGPSSPACFAALSRYELSVAGKKLVGSAQKRGQQSLLQHGSIPLSMDRQLLFQCLRVPGEHQARLVKEAYATMTAINEVTSTPITAATLRAALRDRFAATCGIELVEGCLSSEEWRLTEQLHVTKYATNIWNLEGTAAWRRRCAVAASPAEKR